MIFNETIDKYSIKDIHINNFVNRKFCVFDLEATGLDYNNEFIIQIGAVIVEDLKIDYGNTFMTYVKSPKPIPSNIEKLTSINSKDIINAPVFCDAYKSFIDYAGESILVAQCGFEFDFHLLKKECIINHIDVYKNVQIDTKVLFANIHRDIDETFSSDYLLSNYKIPNENVKRHDALGDSILVGRILIAILKEYKEKGFEDFSLEKEIVIKKFIPKPLI